MEISAFLFQTLSVAANLLLFIAVAYYFLNIWAREKRLEQKENKLDSDYHHIVDTAMAKERKIIEDAAYEADQILSGATYINQASKESIHIALQKMLVDVQKETYDTSRNFMARYQDVLNKLADQSSDDFKSIAKELELNLQKKTDDFQEATGRLKEELEKEIKEFHERILPSMEKELEEYKKVRMQKVDQSVVRVIQKASQEILNKTLSLDDHQSLVIDSLERAKKEGVFD